MGEELYNKLDYYGKEFWKGIELSFGIKLEGMSSSVAHYDNAPYSFNARFPTKNSLLVNTSYLHTTNRLIHFTSLPVLFSIISVSNFFMNSDLSISDLILL